MIHYPRNGEGESCGERRYRERMNRVKDKSLDMQLLIVYIKSVFNAYELIILMIAGS